MLKAKTPQELGSARSSMSNVGRGLLKPPVTSSPATVQENLNLSDQKLPPRRIAEQILQAYVQCVHRHFPVLYWPDFEQGFVEIYEHGVRASMPRESLALLFSVLACGSLFLPNTDETHQGEAFLTQAISLIDIWKEETTTTQAVVGFLASLFLFESNKRSAAWVWLGSAIRIAQDMGLHVQGGQWSTVEGEMRKRIWYSFYCLDR